MDKSLNRGMPFLTDGGNRVMLLVDPGDGRIVEAGDAALRFYGCSRERLLAMNMADLDRDGAGSPIEELRKAGLESDGRLVRRHCMADGSRLDVELVVWPVISEGRELLCVLVLEAGGSSEQDRNLRETADLYRQILDNAGDGIFITGLDGRFLDFNRLAHERLGYTREEMQGLTPPEIDTPESAAQFKERWNTLLTTGRLFAETEHRRKDGSILPVEINSTIIQYHGRPAVLTIARDITQRKEFIRGLEEQKGFFQHLIDVIPNPMFYKDIQGRFQGCNRAFEVHARLTREQLAGKTVFDLFDEEIARRYQAADDQLFEHPGVRSDEELVWDAEGGEHRVIFSKAPFFDKEGRVAGMIGVFNDITERVQLEEVLRRSEEKYRNLVESIDDAIYSVDTIGLINYVSPAFERITGFRREEAEGRDFRFFIYPEDLPALEERFALLLKEDAEPAEFRVRAHDGGLRWVRADSRRIFQDGRLVGLRGRMIDVTENRRNEEAIQTLVESTVGNIGQEFFDRIVNTLSRWLGADVVIIGELSGPASLHPLSMIIDGAHVKMGDYSLAGTPCETVRKGGFKYYPENVTGSFPDNVELRNLGAEAYVGVPLVDKDGAPIGIINAVFRKKVNLTKRTQDILSIIAARASAEIEHKRLKERLSVESGINSAFAGLSSSFLNNMSLGKIAATVLEYSRSLTASEKGFTAFVDPKGDELIIPRNAVTGSSSNDESFLNRLDCRDYMQRCGWSPDSAKPLIVNDAASDSHAGCFPGEWKGLGRFMIVPARIEGELIGVVAVADAAVDYTDEHVAVLERAADLFALAIQRRRAEEQVRKLSVAVEQSPTSIVITDKNGSIEYVNPKFSQLTGYSFQEVIGQNPRILKTDHTLPEVYRELWDTILSGNDWKGEFLNRKKNGELFWEMASIAPVKNDIGEITHFIGVKKDITEQKKAEEELRRAHDELELRVQERTLDITRANMKLKNEISVRQRAEVALKLERRKLETMLSQKGLLADIASRLNSNDSFTDVASFLLDDIRCTMGLESADLYCFNEDQRSAELLAAGDHDGDVRRVFRQPVLTMEQLPGMFDKIVNNSMYFTHNVAELDGNERLIFNMLGIDSLLVCPLSLAGKVKGFVIFTHSKLHFWVPEETNLFMTIADMIVGAWERSIQVRELIEAEKKRTEATRLAEQSSRMASIGVMAGGITHEINQPLNAIKLTADSVVLWIQRNPVEIPGKMLEKFRKISEHVNRIDEIIKHMRQFWIAPSHAASEVFSLNTAVNSALDLLDSQISSHGIRLELDLAGDECKVQGSRIHLEQIMINLVVNAMQAMDAISGRERIIGVSSVIDKEKVRIEVRDNGPGFTPEAAEKLFDPFYSTKKPGSGTGLGLAIVKRFVDGMNGWVEAGHVPGGGARFTVTLPLAKERKN